MVGLALVSAFPGKAWAAARTWDGQGDGVSWGDPLNWSGDTIPDTNDIAVIDDRSVPFPITVVLSSGATVASLYMEAGATLTLNGANLRVQQLLFATNAVPDGTAIINGAGKLIHGGLATADPQVFAANGESWSIANYEYDDLGTGRSLRFSDANGSIASFTVTDSFTWTSGPQLDFSAQTNTAAVYFPHMTVPTGATLTCSNKTFTIGGNFIVNGALAVNTASFTFSGAGVLNGASALTFNAVTITSSGNYGGATSLNITNAWTNDGVVSFSAGTVSMTNNAALGGSGSTLFYALSIANVRTMASGTDFSVTNALTLTGTLTCASGADPNVITSTNAAWSGGGAFNAGTTSKVVFGGTAVNLPGQPAWASLTFHDVQIDATTSAWQKANYFVTGDWISNQNTFVPGSTAADDTVTFQGAQDSGGESRILGSAPVKFNRVEIASADELQIDGGDDVTVDTLVVATGGELEINDVATLRVGSLLDINGRLEINSGSPTIINTDADLYAFTVAATVAQDGMYMGATASLFLKNPNDSGLRLESTAAAANLALQNIYFSNDDGLETGSYLTVDHTTATFSFQGLTFDSACLYSVSSASGRTAGTITLPGSAGAKGEAAYENDYGAGANPGGGSWDASNPDTTGDVRWPAVIWDNGGVGTAWATDDNWNPATAGGPDPADKVVIPDVAGTGANPVITADPKTMASLTIKSGGAITTSGSNFTLNITGMLATEPDTGAGPGTLTFSAGGVSSISLGALDNRGTITVASDATFSPVTIADNFGTLDLSGMTTQPFQVQNNFNNSTGGVFVAPANMTVTGNFNNQVGATFTAGTGTVTMNNTTGVINSNGDAFYHLTIASGSSYTAADGLVVNGTLTVNGTLYLPSTLSINAMAGTGTIVFSGSTAQTIPVPSSGNYPSLTITNTGAAVSATGNFTVNGDLSIGAGASFNAGGSTVTVGGDWINQGSFVTSGSTVKFTGSASTVGGSVTTTFDTFEIGSGAVVDVSTTATPANVLKITTAWVQAADGAFVSGTSTVDFIGTACTISGTGPAAGARPRVLVFFAHAEDNDNPLIAVTSVSYGGQALSKIHATNYRSVDSDATRAMVEAWYLDEAGLLAAGDSSFTVVWNQPPDKVVYTHAFFGSVDQTTPIGASATANFTDTSNPLSTAALAVAAGDMAVAGATNENDATYSAGNGFSKGMEFADVGTMTALSIYKAATAPGTETPQVSSANPSDQQLVGFVLNKAAGSPQVDSLGAWAKNLTHTQEPAVFENAFYNLTVSGTLSLGSNSVDVVAKLTNNGTINAGTSTVNFVSTSGEVCGSPVVFNAVTIANGSRLTLNGGADVTIPGVFTVSSGRSLQLVNDCTLRVGASLIIEGTLTAGGSPAPTITDTGTDFAMTVQGAAWKLDVSALNIKNPDNNGLRIATQTFTSLKLDGVSFSNDDLLATGTYIFFDPAVTNLGAPYTFNNLSFDSACQYNVSVAAAFSGVNTITMAGFGGDKGGLTWEDEDNQTAGQQPAGGDVGGKISWPEKQWTGASSTIWDGTNGNWTPQPEPVANDRVIIPGAPPASNNPTFDRNNQVVASLTIKDGASMDYRVDSRELTVSGQFVVEGDLGLGGGSLLFDQTNSTLDVTGLTSNAGTITIAGLGGPGTCRATFAAFTNSGTLKRNTTSLNCLLTINGTLTNTGTLGGGTARMDLNVGGDFINDSAGVFIPGTGTVTLQGTNNILTTGGDSFFRVIIPEGAKYTVTDDLVLTENLTVHGTLIITKGLTIGGELITSSTGTIEYAGSVAQTIARPAVKVLNPDGSYRNLAISNTSAGGASLPAWAAAGDEVVADGSVTIKSGGALNGGTGRLEVSGNFTNDGAFTPGATSRVTFKGAASTILGSVTTTFRDLTINTAPATLSINTTASPAHVVAVQGTWTNNGSFTQGSSTVRFSGVSGAIAGAGATTFFNLEVTGTLSGGSASWNVQKNWHNAGTFTAGSSSVTFTGASCTVSGASVTVFNTMAMAASSALTLDGADDVRVNTAFTVPATATLTLKGSAILRLASSITVEGSLLAPAPDTPTITDTGTGYAFTVQNGGLVNVNGLNVQNPNNNGLTVAANAGTAIDLDKAAFSGGNPAATTYVRLLYTSIAAGTYNFAGCTFDSGCLYNISTVNNAGVVGQAVRMSGSGGAKGTEAYENDKGAGSRSDNNAADDSIEWPVYTWDGEANDGLWSNPVNWDDGANTNGAIPGANDNAVIPDKATWWVTWAPNGTTPVLNLTTSIGSLLIEDGGTLNTSGASRSLTIGGALVIQADQGAGAPGALNFSSAGGLLTVAGSVTCDGTATITGSAATTLSFNGGLTVGGGFASSAGAVFNVTGSVTVTSTGSFTPGSVSVSGNWSNAGAFTAGSGMVTLNGVSGTIQSSGDAFFDLTIPNGSSYSAQDALTVTDDLDLDGTLVLATSLSVAKLPASATGLARYAGSAAQTVALPSVSGGYQHLEIANSSATVSLPAGTVVVGGNFTIAVGATCSGGSATVTVAGNWTNNGTFSAGTGTVSTSGAPSTIAGSAITTFANLTIASGSLSIATSTTPSNTVRLTRAWTNNGGFTPGSSTVEFSGAFGDVKGSSTTSFSNLTVSGTLSLNMAGGSMSFNVQKTFTNAGSFTADTSTVTFTGASSAVAGSSATIFNTLALSGATLTLDGTDDVRVNQPLVVPAGSVLTLKDSAVLRLAQSLTVEGSLTTPNGATPTITDTGARYAFTVQNGGTAAINGLSVQNPNSNGLTIAANAGTALAINKVSFSGGNPAATTYLRLLFTSITTNSYNFAGCSFDAGCLYAVSTVNNAGVQTLALRMSGAGGAKGTEYYENDKSKGSGVPPDGRDDSGGANDSVEWPVYTWDGEANDGLWNNAVNWDDGANSNGAIPGANDNVVIPDAATWLNPPVPAINLSTTIGSLLIEDGGTVTTSGASRTLTIKSNLTLQADLGAGAPGVFTFSSNGGTLRVEGSMTNAGDFNLTGNASTLMQVLGGVTTSGSFDNTTGALIDIDGALTNSGSLFNPASITVGGNWANTGTYAVGGISLTLNGVSGTLANGGQSLLNLTIPGGCTYTANDALTIVTGLTVAGTLKLKNALTHGTAFTATGGTVQFDGAAAQTVNAGPSPYNHLIISNPSASGASLGGSVSAAGNCTIESGAKLVSGANTLTVTGNWVNHGAFTASSGSVVFNGAPSIIQGSALTTFNTLTINASKSLEINTATTPDDTIFLTGAWTNNGGFTAGSSTVEFTGAGGSIAGSSTTVFKNLSIASGGVLTLGAITVDISAVFTNNGTFNAGSSTMRFTGAGGAVAGTSATVFNSLAIPSGGALSLDGADDVTTAAVLNVNSGATLAMTGNATLRLSTAGLSLNGGTFTASGSTPTVTDTGAKFAFTIDGAGTVNIDALNVANPDANGVTVAAAFSGSLDLDGMNFAGGNSVSGTYLRLLQAAIGAGTYSFSNCAFDANCLYNVSTKATVSTSAVRVTGSSGARSGEGYEDEDNQTAGRQTATPGKIEWPVYTWDGEANDGLWSNPVNWDDGANGNATIPGAFDNVVIPDKANWWVTWAPNGATPTLNLTTSIGSLLIQDGGTLNTSGASRNLTVKGGLTVEADTGAGAPGVLNFSSNGGILRVEGSMSVSGDVNFTGNGSTKLQVLGSFTAASTGTFDNTAGATIDIDGSMTSAGAAFNPGAITVAGNWSSSGTYGASVIVTLDGASGNFQNAGGTLNAVTVPAGSSYTATDALTIASGGALTVNGTLVLKSSLTLTGATLSGTGTVRYAGVAAQTVTNPPAGGYYHLEIANSAGCTLGAGTITVAGTLTIESGTLGAGAGGLSIAGDFINNGAFDSGTGTVTFTGGASTIAGSVTTTFNHLTIAASAALDVNTTASPAHVVKVKGAWTRSNGTSTFTAGSSTIEFTGASSSIAGTVTTTFKHLTVGAGATLSVSSTGNTVAVTGIWTQTGAFNRTGKTVAFSGAGAGVSGTTVLDAVTLSGTLSLDSNDDVTVESASGLVVSAGSTLALSGTATLRLGTATTAGLLNVNGGALTAASGSTQTITAVDVAAPGSATTRFAFTVQGGGTVVADGLNVAYVNDNGLNIAASAATAIDLDSINFTGGSSAATTYLTLGYNAPHPVTGAYTFSGCSFDANCQYNVATPAGASSPGNDQAFSFPQAGGTKAGGQYEYDRAGGVLDPGSVYWPVFTWDGDANDGVWTNVANWDDGTGANPTAAPGVNDNVVIPDAATWTPPAGATPTIAASTSVRSMTIQDGGSAQVTAASVSVTVSNFITLAADGGSGGGILTYNSSGGTLTVASLTDSGTFTLGANAQVTFTTLTVNAGATFNLAGSYTGGQIVLSGACTVTSLDGGVFSTHPGTNLAYLDAGAYTGSPLTLSSCVFNRDPAKSAPTFNIKATAGTPYITVVLATGSLAGDGYDQDPNERVRWFDALPERESSVGNTDYPSMVTAIANSTGAGASVTVYDNIPHFGDLTLTAANMGAATDVTIKRAHIIGNVTLNNAGATVTLENCMIVGNVNRSAGVLNMAHCSVNGSIGNVGALSSVARCIASGAISPAGTENKPGVAAATTFVNAAKWDLHLASTDLSGAKNGATSSAPNEDFDGGLRPLGGNRDIGADEVDDSGAIGQMLWDFETVNPTYKLGPVLYIATNVYYGYILVGTGKDAGNDTVPAAPYGAGSGDYTMWENALLMLDMDSGAIIAAMCGVGTARANAAAGIASENIGFSSDDLNYYMPGPVHHVANWFDTTNPAAWCMRLHVVCDANGDGNTDTLRYYRVPINTGVMPHKSNRPFEAGWSYTAANINRNFASDFTVVGGPISHHFALSWNGTNMFLYLSADQDTARDPGGDPVLFKLRVTDGNLMASALNGATYPYNVNAGVVSYSNNDLFTGLKATGTATNADLVKLDDTLTPLTIQLLTGPGGAHRDGLSLAPKAGFMGQSTLMVASADEWLRRFNISTFNLDTSFDGDGYVGLEDAGISTAAASQFVGSPERFWGMNNYLSAYKTNESRSYVAKIQASGASTDPDWKLASRVPMRGALLPSLTKGAGVDSYAATDEGFVYGFSYVDGAWGGGDDGALLPGYPLRIPGVGIRAMAFSFISPNRAIFVVSKNNRVLAHRIQ